MSNDASATPAPDQPESQPAQTPAVEAAGSKRRRGPAAMREEVKRRNKLQAKRQPRAAESSQDGDAQANEEALPVSEMAADELGGGDAGPVNAEGAVRHDPDWDAFSEITSGVFDETETAEAEAVAKAPKRVLQPQADAPKLHKVLAQAGLGSRLEMERMIGEGRIWVNSEPAHVGQRIQFGDVVKVNGRPVQVRIAPPPARIIAYHKPEGEVVSHNDPQNRPTVFRSLPKLPSGKWQSVGRLDLNTEGLLLFTNSGNVANRLMHPSFGLQRQYAVRVLGALTPEEKQRLLDGVQLDDGPAQFSAVEDGGGEGVNQWYSVTISEGRNREVRRMMEAVGHAVSRLIRIRYGAMVLPRGLRRGQWMELDDRDIRALTDAVGLPQVGHEVPAYLARKSLESTETRNKRGRNADRSGGRKGGPRPSGGPLSQSDQRMEQAREYRMRNAREGFNRVNRGEASFGGDEFIDRRVAEGRGSRNSQGAAGRGQGAEGARGASGQADSRRPTQGFIGAESFMRQRKDGGARGGKRSTGGGRSGGGNRGRR